MRYIVYYKSSNKRPTSFKHPHSISVLGIIQNQKKCSMQGGIYSKNLVLFESFGCLFQSYLVFSGIILIFLLYFEKV